MQRTSQIKTRPLRLLLLLAALYLGVLAGVLPMAASNKTLAQEVQEAQVVRIAAPTAAQRWQLAALGLDLLEQREGDDLFAIVTPQQMAQLKEQGWDVRADPQQTALLPGVGARPASFAEGYRTVEETEQHLRDLVVAYPQLATLVDYGDSW